MLNFDTANLSDCVLRADKSSALAHCEECGEIIDSFDRCGCDY